MDDPRHSKQSPDNKILDECIGQSHAELNTEKQPREDSLAEIEARIDALNDKLDSLSSAFITAPCLTIEEQDELFNKRINRMFILSYSSSRREAVIVQERERAVNDREKLLNAFPSTRAGLETRQNRLKFLDERVNTLARLLTTPPSDAERKAIVIQERNKACTERTKLLSALPSCKDQWEFRQKHIKFLDGWIDMLTTRSLAPWSNAKTETHLISREPSKSPHNGLPDTRK
ncbi:hypothetical protein TWF481_010217 [Arthrobotrys musiformis]|uniref:Centromere protein H C-terminal domain-containing protein n=1 Tax=Arthrobotrys musiformis TaxID=47236 RepID=A0AAV9W193_9PEZI